MNDDFERSAKKFLGQNVLSVSLNEAARSQTIGQNDSFLPTDVERMPDDVERLFRERTVGPINIKAGTNHTDG
jgi:hypothetical protein